jgi:propanol-preferring alcohol dehydrogenase
MDLRWFRWRPTFYVLSLWRDRDFATPIFDVVLKRITLRGSIVGTRKDLAEAIEFASEGKVRAHIHQLPIEKINHVFADLKAGKVDGRIVIKF